MNLRDACDSTDRTASSTGNPYLSALADFANRTKEPSSETVNLLMRYEPETGHLFWKPRPESAFENSLECNRWNTLHTQEPAGAASFVKGRRRNITISQRFRGEKKYRAAQRLIWIMLYGEIPENCVIDHINGDPFDNRLCNLRVATRKQNAQNRGAAEKNTHKFKGVRIANKGYPNIFRAVFQGADGAKKHLGTFTSTEEAAKAYDEEAQIVYGEFARLNLPKV